jgi:hypothetical protein
LVFCFSMLMLLQSTAAMATVEGDDLAMDGAWACACSELL